MTADDKGKPFPDRFFIGKGGIEILKDLRTVDNRTPAQKANDADWKKHMAEIREQHR